MELKQGDKVRVWQDPMTRQDFEGLAMLRECHSKDAVDGTERWMVEFIGDEGIRYERTVTIIDLEADPPSGGWQTKGYEDAMEYRDFDVNVLEAQNIGAAELQENLIPVTGIEWVDSYMQGYMTGERLRDAEAGRRGLFCKSCGSEITDATHDDNGGLCDDCSVRNVRRY